MKLIIYTKRKRWDFDWKSARWEISDSWVYVHAGKTTYIFPRESIAFMMIQEEEKEGEKK
jgi:hypothetical protein